MAERRAAGNGSCDPSCACSWPTRSGCCATRCWPPRLPDDPYLDASLAEYFPPAVVERFGHLMGAHPLRREIVATIVTNDVINSMGDHVRLADGGRDRRRPRGGRRGVHRRPRRVRLREPWDAVEKLDRVVRERRAGRPDGRRRHGGRAARTLVSDAVPHDRPAGRGRALAGAVRRARGGHGRRGPTAWRLARTSAWTGCSSRASPARRRGSRPSPPTWSTRPTSSPSPRRTRARSPTSPTPSL